MNAAGRCFTRVNVGLGTSVACRLDEGHVGDHVSEDGIYRWDGTTLHVVIEAAWHGLYRNEERDR